MIMNSAHSIASALMLLGKGGAAAAWTPDSPTDDGGVSPHTYFDLVNGLYQDSAKTTAVASDGDVVGAEENQGSDTYDVVQATTANKPLYKTGILNGEPMLLFDGVDDYLAGAFAGGLISQPITAFVVAQLASGRVNNNAGYNIIDGDDTTNRLVIFKGATGSPDTWEIFAGSTLVGSVAVDANAHILCAIFNGASSELIVDGASHATGNAGTKGIDGLSVGRYPGGSGYWSDYIGKRLIYEGDLSTADKNQVGNFLADFYGLTWTDIT